MPRIGLSAGSSKWYFPISAFGRLRGISHKFPQLSPAVLQVHARKQNVDRANKACPVEVINDHVYYFTGVKLEVLALSFHCLCII